MKKDLIYPRAPNRERTVYITLGFQSAPPSPLTIYYQASNTLHGGVCVATAMYRELYWSLARSIGNSSHLGRTGHKLDHPRTHHDLDHRRTAHGLDNLLCILYLTAVKTCCEGLVQTSTEYRSNPGNTC